MKRVKIESSVWLAACLVLVATMWGGCTERELSERPSDGPLKINLVWDDAEYEVSGALLWLYGSDGTLYQAVRSEAEGYEARVPADVYTVLVVNADCINAEHDGEEDADFCSIDADVLASGSSPLLAQVEHVYCTGLGGIEVKPGNVTTEVTLYPEDVVKHIRFDIDPNYLDNVASLTVNMGGIVPSVYMRNGEDTQEATGIVSVEAQPAQEGHYDAQMSVFGWRGLNVVTVTVVYEDGREETSLPEDITDDLEGLPEEGGSISLTVQMPDGSTLDITAIVSGWDDSGTGSGDVW